MQARPGESADLVRALVATADTDKDVAGVPAAAVNHARGLIARSSGPLTVVLYDVNTLYFEAEREDKLRKVGMSKERRVDPHHWADQSRAEGWQLQLQPLQKLQNAQAWHVTM